MDRDTLSHYGWIVVMILCLSVLLATATPFGEFIADAIIKYTDAYIEAGDNMIKDMEQDAIDKYFPDGTGPGGNNSCSHENKTYTPIDDYKHNVDCDDCNKDLGDLSHTYTDGTCTECSHNCSHDIAYTVLNSTYHSVKCKICSKTYDDELHTYVDGVCSKCNYVCTHPNKTYTPIDDNTHKIVCDDCGKDLGEETHNYTDGECEDCEKTCSHSNVKYTAINDSIHSKTCSSCQKDLGTENHTYVDSVCTKCNHECTHSNTTITPNDDTTHKTTCDDCGKDLGDEEHNYNDDSTCDDCENECKHEDIIYTPNNEETHHKECADCDKDFGDENHDLINGDCTKCDYVCNHDNISYVSVDVLEHSVICNKCDLEYNEEHTYVNEICTKCNRERNLIPVGDTYYVGVTSTAIGNYTGATQTLIGDGKTVEYPVSINKGDVYVSGDYEYRYNYYYDTSAWRVSSSQNGWGVKVLDTSKDKYSVMLSSINKTPVKVLQDTYRDCINLKIAPEISPNAVNLTSTFQNCTALNDISKVVIPNTVTTLTKTFYNCEKLNDVSGLVIPSSVTAMNSTFYGCSSLTKTPNLSQAIQLKDMTMTFYNCTSLTTDGISAIPSSVTTLKYTFKDCTSLITAPLIPSNVTNMFGAFNGCSSLTTAPIIPNNVTDIGYVLASCSALTTAPDISNCTKITNMSYSFHSCLSLTGTIEINANPTTYTACFRDTEQKIYLTGSSNVLHELADSDTYSNFTENDNVQVLTYLVDAKEMTCTENGYTGDIYCECHDTLMKKGSTIVAPGHDLVANYLNVDYVAQWDCQRCGAAIIPEGAKYIDDEISNDIQYSLGSAELIGDGKTVEFPKTVGPGDEYTYNGYYYHTFQGSTQDGEILAGFNVTLDTNSVDKNQTQYNEVLGSINGVNTIGMNNTFQDCTNLLTVPEIPKTVIYLYDTFNGCTSLTTAPTLPDSVLFMENTFENCVSLMTYEGSTDANGDFSNYVIPTNIRNLDYVFNGCTSLVKTPILSHLSYGLLTMNYTFANCTSLTTATIPDCVYELKSTFENCVSLSGTIEINANVSYNNNYNRCFYGTKQKIYLTGSSVSLGYLAASDGRSDYSAADNVRVLVDNPLPEGVTYYVANSSNLIGDGKVGNYYSYKQMLVGDGLTVPTPSPYVSDVYVEGQYEYRYGNYYNGSKWQKDGNINGWSVRVLDTSLSTYDAPLSQIFGKNVVSMYYTYAGCTSLTKIPSIPSTITDMTYTFFNCTALTNISNVVIPNTVTSMTNTFYNCRNLVDASGLIIPNSVTNMQNTFYNCIALAKTPNFSNCTKLTDMTGTFYNCTSLTEIPDLSNCTQLKKMETTFSHCSSLTSDGSSVIPEGVTDMYKTFDYCTSLTKSPSIPTTVTDMGYTFYGCTSLAEMPDLSNCTQLIGMSGTFYDCSSLTSDGVFVIPNSVTNMKSTFRNCTSLTTAPTIPSSVTNMERTFQGCTALTGTIEIDANPSSYTFCFANTTQKIYLTGSSTLLNQLATTSNGNVVVQ